MKKKVRFVSLWGKIMSLVLAGVLLTGLLAGCGSKNSLADVFDEETVKKQAMDDITLAQSSDFEGWKNRFSPEVQSAVTEDAYKNYLNTLDEKGTFKEFGRVAVVGQEQNGTNYAVAVVICKYENGDIKYTIAYDEQMNLIQFTI